MTSKIILENFYVFNLNFNLLPMVITQSYTVIYCKFTMSYCSSAYKIIIVLLYATVK